MDLPPIYASPGDRNDDVSAAEMAQRHLAVTPLLRGLGGSLTMSNSDDADDFLEEAGRTLQAAIKGLLDLQQQRNSLSDKHLRPLEDNPLRLNMDYATALDVMFAEGKSPVHLAAPAAVSESLRNVRHHEEANRAAIVESLRVLLDAFSPQNLLRRFVQYLLAIQNAPVPGKSALKAVQLRLDQNSSDPIFATRQMAKTLPAPLNRWVGRLTDQAWHVVMVEAVHYMEVDWRDSVVKPFNEQLANNYPFNPRSAQDASLDAFERFFKPDGILDTFYQQNLKLFIDNDLSLEDGDNNVIIREDIIAQLETAQKIRDIFFSKQNGLGTSFAVETVSLSGNKRRSVLNLDGQLVDYSQGRNYTAHLVWPNNMREGNESKLTLIGTSGNAPRSISFSGPWAQFRLFGAGQLTGVQDGNFTVRFSVDGGAMTYRVHTDTEDNPFSGGLFSQFGLSDTLY